MTGPGKLRLLLATAMLLAVVGLSACGGGGTKTKLPPALENALKYLPKDESVVVVAPTNLGSGPLKQLDDLGSARVEGWSRIRSQLQRQLIQDATKQEVDATLGNPLALAVSGRSSNSQNIAIQVRDPAAVRSSVAQDASKDKEKLLPTYKGTFVWQDLHPDNDNLNFNGLKGNMLFAADTEQLLHAAIDNSEGSDNANSDEDFKPKLADLGEGSLLRVVGDSQRLLEAGGNTDKARKVKFVQSLGMFWSSAKVVGTGVEDQAVLETDNTDLSSEDIPLSTENASFTVPSASSLAAAALVDPDHVVKFAETAAKQASPDSFDQYQQGLAQLKATGVDLHKDLLSRVKQLSVAIVGTKRYEFRAELQDGQQFSESLQRGSTFLGGVIASIGSGLKLSLEGSGPNATYVVKRGSTEVARFAVRGNALVGSIGPAAGLPSPTADTPLDAAPGALAIDGQVAQIVRLPGVRDSIGSNGSSALEAQILSSLGPVTLSVSETTQKLTVKGKLAVGK